MHVVLPAVNRGNFDAVRELAHAHQGSYALGIHPLCVDACPETDLDRLREALKAGREDPRLVAVGEIGIDHFVPGLDRAKQERFFVAQIELAHDLGLPVVVHTRKSSDTVLKHLRRVPVRGIAHAYNGSGQQAAVFVELGFRLGFGGAMTFDRALQIRRLAASVPDHAFVLETDSPDIPPHWLYRTAEERADGPQARNEPAQLPRIAAVLAALRGIDVADVQRLSTRNAVAALPKLGGLIAA